MDTGVIKIFHFAIFDLGALHVSFGVMPTALFFFFSSRRRHTRLHGDWSSDVCSSDLERRRQLRELAEPRGVGKCFATAGEIGRASWRERVEFSGGGVALKKK